VEIDGSSIIVWECFLHWQKLHLCWFDKVPNTDPWTRTNQMPRDIQVRKRKWRWINHTLWKEPSNISRQEHNCPTNYFHFVEWCPPPHPTPVIIPYLGPRGQPHHNWAMMTGLPVLLFLCQINPLRYTIHMCYIANHTKMGGGLYFHLWLENSYSPWICSL